jgi:hypothetical protein
MAWMSIALQSPAGSVSYRVVAPAPRARSVSFSQVDRGLRQAFQYRWNRSSEVGWVVMLRQVTTSRPVIVRDAGSRSTSIE